MIAQSHASGGRLLFSSLAGLLLAIAPLPAWLAPARPDFLLLLVIYWSLSAPHIAGLLFAWLCGFGIDVLQGPVLGQHALAFLVVGFLTHKRQLQLRIYPVAQQAAAVFVLLLVYQFILFWLDGVVGSPVTSWLRWLPTLTGALAWPLFSASMDTWIRRRY